MDTVSFADLQDKVDDLKSAHTAGQNVDVTTLLTLFGELLALLEQSGVIKPPTTSLARKE